MNLDQVIELLEKARQDHGGLTPVKIPVLTEEFETVRMHHIESVAIERDQDGFVVALYS